MKLSRRDLLTNSVASLAASALTTGAALFPGEANARSGGRRIRGYPRAPENLAWDGRRMLDSYMKARSSLRDEFTIGWVDATTFAVFGGDSAPLYRLLAATWQRHQRASDTAFGGQALEVAFYLDVNTGERIEKLTMPRTGTVVDVPNYRSGPSPNKQVVQERADEEFNMGRETQNGSGFFRSGRSFREQYLSQPQRDGDEFLIRQTLNTRVVAAGSEKPVFFYQEWTVNRAPWQDIVDTRVVSCPVEVQYSSIAAFRPWMQMSGVDGYTLQNGRGGKVWQAEQLPAQLLALCQIFHADLITAPDQVFAAKRG